MLAKAAFPALFFTLAGFLLLLLVALSVPIIKTIYLLSIYGPGASGNVRLGVFGVCYEGGNAEILGFAYSGYNRCSDVSVGYDLDPQFFGNVRGDAGRFFAKTLAGALVVNPVAAGFAALSLVWALLAWCASSRISEILTCITLFFASLLAWIAFALDLAIALVARKRVEDYTNDVFNATIGSAVWLTLAAAIMLSIAMCAAGCGSFGRYSEDRYSNKNVSPGMTVHSEKPARRWQWQRKAGYQSRGTY